MCLPIIGLIKGIEAIFSIFQRYQLFLNNRNLTDPAIHNLLQTVIYFIEENWANI